ncbi:MAG: HlyD family secretion protein [Ramlibacter sp.]|nr:HlyD family secretion protein [Ramlibacter sp.]
MNETSLRPSGFNLPPAMRRLAVAAAIAVGLASAAFAATSLWRSVRASESTENAYVKGDLTYVSTKVSGYVLSVETENNRLVGPGQIVLRIDPRDYEVAVEQSRAAIARAQADVAQIDAQTALQQTRIGIAAAVEASARASTARANKDSERAERLVGVGGTSRADYDRALNEQVARASSLDEAQGQSKGARQQLNVLKAQRQAAEAALLAARAQLAKAESDLAATIIRAPREGRIAARNARPGEYLSVGSRVMAVVPTRGLWVEAYLKETQVGRLEPGSRVRVRVDALPGMQFCGTLESISNGSGSEMSLIPPDNATGNFTKIVRRFPVRVLFDDGQPGMDRLGIGMSAIPRFETGSQEHRSGQECPPRHDGVQS